ncbi:MAG TPA: ABC transporter ATP-binding protein [Anaerolineae bacterium]|nr:ABC transporter ATP-binding protein [Anaerolineae bacterium]
MKHLFRAMRFLKEYWLLAVGMFGSLLIATASMLVIPRMSQYVIDEGIIGRDASKVLWMSLAMVGFAGSRALFQFAQGALAARVAEGVAYDMRNALYAKIQSLSFSYHDRAQTGQLLTRATSDVDRVQRFVGRGAINLLSALLMMGGSLAVLFTANWRLALIMVVIIPLTLATFGFFARKAMPLFKTVQECLGNLNTVLQENLAGVRVVKAFAREPYESSRYEAANRAFYDVSIEVNNIMSLAFPTVFGISNAAILSVYWIGGMQAIGGILTVGQLVAFANYFMMAFFPVLMLGMIVAMLSNAAASAERVFDILDARSQVVEKPDAVPLPPIEGRVVFENVTFRYYGSGDPVLRGVSFVAEPGQTVALLGGTGSGKSTIINLIPRFYDISGDGCEGRVTVDGYDVRDVKLDSLRAQTGIVLQETTLFEGTIRENIAFGRPEAALEEIIGVAKAAEAHDFIMSFAEGYETHVGERGVTLSGGQKQRIAIARALLHDPKILILDDATSSVDLVTDYRIHQALSRLMKGRTSFVIAQRVATVLNADQILVLDNGGIVARGLHEELLASSEIYAEIYSSQLEDDAKPSFDPTAVAGVTA